MKTPNTKQLLKEKKELGKLIIQNNYNLLAPEVLNKSQQVDTLILPFFYQQLYPSLNL